MMAEDLDPESPVVVGALGGSGTRVLGDVLMGAGVHIGGNLNTANDSVTATVLFNRPRWAARAAPEDMEVTFHRLRRFLLRRGVSVGDHAALIAAGLRPGHTEGVRRRMRYVRRVYREKGPGSCAFWGWKEPNSHLFLPELATTFPGLRFVYLARHPLDMAFSTNLNQLKNWGERYGVRVGDAPDELARGQLDLWVAATRSARTIGPELLGDRFLCLRFDDLVDQPRSSVDQVVNLVGASVSEADRSRLAELPRRPRSDGRHRDQDLSVFRPDQLDAVAELWGEI
jgi:Sulfotransferase family